MIAQIYTIKDVTTFAEQLIKEGLSFHPDDDFNDYVQTANKPFYTKTEAAKRNKLMTQCFKVCEKEGADIYGICLKTTLIETGLDQFIPLPSLA